MSYFDDTREVDTYQKTREDGFRDGAIARRDDQLKRLTAMRQAELTRTHMGQGDMDTAPTAQAIPYSDGQGAAGAGAGGSGTTYPPLVRTKDPATPDQSDAESMRLARGQATPNPDEAGLAALSRMRRAQLSGAKVDPTDERTYGEYVARQRQNGWKGPAATGTPDTNMQVFQDLKAKNDTRTEANPNASPGEDARLGRYPAGAPNGSSQYDKPTPYDGLISQAAQQNGIDPGILKRLLGTESSFNPNAANGQAQGIAQIMTQIHKVSPEQARDPAFAIPFAAKLLADKLRAAGGNMERALQMYKGAVSDQGKAAMAGPISQILGGGAQTAQAAPGGVISSANAATPAQFTPEQFFSAAPQVDQQTKMATLRLQQLREMAAVTRDPAQLAKMQEQAMGLQTGIREAQVYQLAAQASGGNEGALSQLVQMMGNVGVARTAQGYVMVDPASGRAMSQPMSAGELAKGIYGNISSVARAQAAEAAKKRAEVAAETEGKVAIEGAKNQGAQVLAQQQGDIAREKAFLEQTFKGEDYKVSPGRDGGPTIVTTRTGVFELRPGAAFKGVPGTPTLLDITPKR